MLGCAGCEKWVNSVIVITRLFYTVFRPISGTVRGVFVRDPIMFFSVAIPLLSPIPLIIKIFTVRLTAYRASHVGSQHFSHLIN